MKLLTLSFLTCPIKSCKPKSTTLHCKNCTLERTSLPFQPLFIRNILPRLDWSSLKTTCTELGLLALLPDTNPMEDVEVDENGEETVKEVDEAMLQKIHGLVMETGIVEGFLVCGGCAFEFPVKEGVGNFLLPPHLV